MNRSQERKLINEEPLLVLPSLAKVMGSNEAIILQQIHYWLTINKDNGNNYIDGYYWTFNSIADWQKQFIWLSTSTIERTLRKLEQSGIIVTSRYNKRKFDRTKWYRIDYDKLHEVCSLDNSPISPNWRNALDQNDVTGEASHSVKMVQPIPEINITETNITENNNLLNTKRVKTARDGEGLSTNPEPSSFPNTEKSKTSKERPTVTPYAKQLSFSYKGNGLDSHMLGIKEEY